MKNNENGKIKRKDGESCIILLFFCFSLFVIAAEILLFVMFCCSNALASSVAMLAREDSSTLDANRSLLGLAALQNPTLRQLAFSRFEAYSFFGSTRLADGVKLALWRAAERLGSLSCGSRVALLARFHDSITTHGSFFRD